MRGIAKKIRSQIQRVERNLPAAEAPAFWTGGQGRAYRRTVTPPAHHAPLVEGWALWRTVWLRSAGFSIDPLEALAAGGTAEALDHLDRVRARASAVRADAAQLLQRATEDAPPGLGKPLGAAIKALRRGEAPKPIEGLAPELVSALAAVQGVSEEEASAAASARAAFAEDTRRAGAALRAAAADPRFREAVLWQNRRALHGTIDALLRQPAGATDSKTREHERLVASYLQRYCAKNETIGFFGPVAWASIEDRPGTVELQPGKEFLARRRVRFERWAIAALADTISGDASVRVQLAPRLSPAHRLERGRLIQPGGAVLELEPPIAALLARCDGTIAAEQLAGSIEGWSSDEIYEALETLAERKLISWKIEVPVWTVEPERALSEALGELAGGEAKSRAEEQLASLEAARDEVARAAGDPVRLDAALATLEQRFEAITGARSVRREGQAYAGRTLIYEDCVRDVSCTFGENFTTALAAPLRLVLLGARWFTEQIGARFSELFLRIVRERSEARGGGAVPWPELWKAIDPHLYGGEGTPAIVSEVATELKSRWQRILGVTSSQRHLELRSEVLTPGVEAAFPSTAPGWPMARFHSPDVLLAARGLEALQRGDFTAILGELHVSVASIFSQVGVAQHPRPDALFEAAAIDLPEVLLTPVESEAHSTRADYLPVKRLDPQLEHGTSRSPLPRSRVIAASELFAREEGGAVVVETTDGRWRLDAPACFGQYLSFASISRYGLLPALDHTPRITIDRLVVERERWRFVPASLSWVAIEDLLERFAAARRWARGAGLPRWVFAKVPEELKPFYVDFESPVYVEILARRLKKASELLLGEMLPAPDELWLTDAEGRRYTSELRMVAVDPG